MSFAGLSQFIRELERKNEIIRISAFVDPELEITEITDRITKARGRALLFTNTGTEFPLLINAYGSDTRMAMALSRSNLDEAATELLELLTHATTHTKSLAGKLASLPSLLRLAAIMPSRSRFKGACQEYVSYKPDLSLLPVLKCWPRDGGRFITLPVVHTVNPVNNQPNAGMYRMQIINSNTTAMHWQMHKTGARHFEEWKKTGKRMPVTVTLGGDPVYAYAATAPLPENIDEYILAGFLRNKGVKLVKCLTNDLYVPEDSDFVIEGYVDPAEKPFWEGPFGDHTGFYSLADWYPLFHVTCISHRKEAVYPATVVGVPPQEDAWLARATEKLFLAPVKMALQPEVTDFHMPDAGIAHNLLIVSINKTYPGQARKVIAALSGAGQMMFTKYIIAVDSNIDIRDYRNLISAVLKHTEFPSDLIFSSGPLDVLDHSSDTFAFGGKLGIDATLKLEGERSIAKTSPDAKADSVLIADDLPEWLTPMSHFESKIIIAGLEQSATDDRVSRAGAILHRKYSDSGCRIIAVVDPGTDHCDPAMAAWQILGNSDPRRDIKILPGGVLYVDGTIKGLRQGGFPRRWPNVVCSDIQTINAIDVKWDSLGLGSLIQSPSLRIRRLLHGEGEEII
jgi:4-hydroxy-3-polyprenylbenzoate decarboxylase